MNNKIKSILGSVLAVCTLAFAVPAAYAASDIDGHWAEKDMQSFVSEGYLNGDGSGSYAPDNAMSRAEFAAVVNRIKDYTLESSNISAYTDVNSDDWFYSDMAVALGAGYLEGSGSSMNPTNTITRQEAFLIIARLIGLNTAAADTSVLSAFSDGSDTASWAENAVAAMVSGGYVLGSDGRLNPNGKLSRAEGVTVLSRVLQVLKSTVVIDGSVYTFSESVFDGATQIGSTGVYYKLVSGEALSGKLYGTAALSYAEYYSGDVTTTEGYDAVSSATTSKYNIMPGIATSEIREDGYEILGVKGVSVQVDAELYVTSAILKAAGAKLSDAQAEAVSILLNSDPTAAVKQYKALNTDGTYSATSFNVVDTVTDAEAELVIGGTWGDYQINVTDGASKYLRNDRSDDWAINSTIQGIILSAKDSNENDLAVGMEYLQSIWVQPWEVSFNITADSVLNAHIASWDNLSELAKLSGSTVYSITYIMPESSYVYKFDDGIFIRPPYTGDANLSAEFESDNLLSVSGIPADFKNVSVSVYFKEGRTTIYLAENAAILDGKVLLSAAPDASATYTVTVSSSNYSDITCNVSLGTIDTTMTSSQRAQLQQLISQADALLSGSSSSNTVLKSHRAEAEELIANESATSDEAAELIAELTELIAKA